MTYPAKCTLYKNNTQLTFTCSKLTIQTKKRCEIYSKLTIKTPERQQWMMSSWCFHWKLISYLFLLFLFLSSKQVSVSWVMLAKFSFTLLILEQYRPGIAFWLLLTENLCPEKHLWIVCDYKFLPIDCMIFLGVDKCTMS